MGVTWYVLNVLHIVQCAHIVLSA